MPYTVNDCFEKFRKDVVDLEPGQTKTARGSRDFVYKNIGALFQIGTTEVDNKIVNKVENGMFIALGIILSDDFLKQTTDLLSSLRYSINNISLKRRKVPNYSYEYFNDENSFLMQRLKDTAIIKEREKITMMISDFCALAVIGNM